MFSGINQGKMDVANIQKSANILLRENEVSAFLGGCEGFDFQDGAKALRGHRHITADKSCKMIRVPYSLGMYG
jgi:hypothetical protein